MSYLSRYLAGEHREVWGDLQALGDSVRHEPVLSDARAVAEETMRRVRRNVEVIEARLRALGYDFTVFPDGAPRTYLTAPLCPPAPGFAAGVQRLREALGPLPLSLEAFWAVVGSVDLVGMHPAWPEMSDPLVVDPPEAMTEHLKDWEWWMETGPDDTGPYVGPFAPDVFHKDNISGGGPYGIQLPDSGADAPVRDGPRHELFVDHLRRSILEWGGFPGFGAAAEVHPDLHALRDGLEPF
jgi:hypothetical protein